MQKKYQRQAREHWQSIIEQFHASGQSGVKFCQLHNISYASFSKWRQSLADKAPCESAVQPAAHFIDLQSFAPRDSAWKIVLRLGADIELELSRP